MLLSGKQLGVVSQFNTLCFVKIFLTIGKVNTLSIFQSGKSEK